MEKVTIGEQLRNVELLIEHKGYIAPHDWDDDMVSQEAIEMFSKKHNVEYKYINVIKDIHIVVFGEVGGNKDE